MTDHRPNGAAKIEIRQLSVSYAGRQVVRGVDLAIPATSIYAWIGPAGSGKASILRTINLLSIEVTVPRSRARSCSTARTCCAATRAA